MTQNAIQSTEHFKIGNLYEFSVARPYSKDDNFTAEYHGYFILGGKTFVTVRIVNKQKKKAPATEVMINVEHIVYVTPVECQISDKD